MPLQACKPGQKPGSEAKEVTVWVDLELGSANVHVGTILGEDVPLLWRLAAALELLK